VNTIIALPSFEELFERLQLEDETVKVEAKTAQEIGKSILTTVSAFANEPGAGGGYFLLGVRKRDGRYEVVGIVDPDKLQANLATLCRNEMNVPVTPLIRIERYEGKAVCVAYIPEAESHQKPVYILSHGLPRGAYRRIGSTDQHCNDDDLALLYNSRSSKPYDETAVMDAGIDDLDSEAIAVYRRRRASRDPAAAELTYDDPNLLLAISAAANVHGTLRPTIAGLMLFGSRAALRRIFPMHRVDYIRVPGREWVPNPEQRYEGNEWRESLMTLVEKAIASVTEDIPSRFSLADGGVYRQDVPLLPPIAVREAVVNALMHRDYNAHQTVQIIRYANRIEIRNPGYSLIPEEQLGEPGSRPRNPRIANVFHDTGLAETKGTGIRTMREAMQRANLTEPLLTSERELNRFVAVLLVQHLLDPADHAWLTPLADCQLNEDQAHALAVVREAGFITNAVFRSLTGLDTLAASKQLQRLRDIEVLMQQGGGPATYYVPGPRLRAAFAQAAGTENPTRVGRSNPVESADSTGLNPVESAPEDANLYAELPPDLKLMVGQVLGYAHRPEIEATIAALCAWRPLGRRQIASILGRNPRYVNRDYLTPMLQRGILEYTHSGTPAHPFQAYRATKKATEEGA